jgi:hypothetical protein
VLSLVIELNEHGGAPFKQECRALVLKYGHTVHASMFVLISTDASRSGIRDAGKGSHWFCLWLAGCDALRCTAAAMRRR